MADLGGPDKARFIARFGPIFEHSPWVAEQAWERRPFADAEALHAAFMAVLEAAEPQARLLLLQAHPELGARVALTDASEAEQQGAGLKALTQPEYDRFAALNARYREKFGFPFIICARLNHKSAILAAFEQRLQHDAETEQAEAIRQIGLIGKLRLADALGKAPAQQAAEAGLSALTARVLHDLACLDYPARGWVRQKTHSSGQHVFDVAIIGGGQCGLATAFGLQREKVENILVLDENPAGFEGPWITYARMVTLRTPKYLTGPDLGLASLTFRAFWEAQYGAAAWAEIGKIPREEWMRYLRWFRATLQIPLRNDAKVELIEPVARGLFRLHIQGSEALLARKVVLATGIQGGGEWHMPSFISKALPRQLYAHTSGPVDFTPFIGRKIGILGGGASAFDNAQFALGQGVAEAHVFLRRKEMPRINPIRFMENAGFLRHFADLPDARKYESMDFFLGHSQPPTNDTFSRAAAYPGFALHLGEPWTEVERCEAGVRVTTPEATHDFAFILASTGLLTDVALRPELSAVAGDIAHWRDRYTPPRPNRLIDDHPYLGPAFEFLPKTPEAADRLHGLFAFNYSALVSLGLSASALSGLKFAAPKLCAGITRQLFLDDEAEILGDFLAYAEQEFIH